MNAQENKLIDLKFKTMTDNMNKLETTIKEGFVGVHNKIDAQEKKFITKDQHELVKKDLSFIKGIFGAGGGFLLMWLLGKLLALI